MKLGEALTLRSQLQTRIEQLRGRLKASALVQEGAAAQAAWRGVMGGRRRFDSLIAQRSAQHRAPRHSAQRTVTTACRVRRDGEGGYGDSHEQAARAEARGGAEHEAEAHKPR